MAGNPHADIGFVPDDDGHDDLADLGFVPDAPGLQVARGPASSQGDLRAFESGQAARGAPARRTLDERMALRGQYTQENEELAQSERRLLNDARRPWRMATGGTLKGGQTEDQAIAEWAASTPGFEDTAAGLDSISTRRAQLSPDIDRLGVGQRGRVIGGAIGGAAGGITGGALGSFAGPAGTVGGAIAGSAGGTALGSFLGSRADIARADDITEEEAAKLLRNQVIEDVALDAAGSLLFFGGGKLLKVAGASAALKNAVSKYFGQSAAAPIAAPAAQAADRWATETGRYVIPGEQGIAASVLERAPIVGVGKQGAERAAAGVNQRITNEAVASDLGLAPGSTITKDALAGVREQAGKAYDAVREAVPGKIRADAEYKQALAELRAKIDISDFPDLDIGKGTLNRIKSLDVAEMAPKSMIQAAKSLRKESSALYRKGESEAAAAHRELADELDDLLFRNVPDQALVTDLQAARQRIAKSYDVQNALTADGEIDARKLGTLSKKRPLTGGMAQAAEFARSNPRLAQLPQNLDWGNAGLNAILGLGGAAEAFYGHDPVLGAGIALGRPGAKAALGLIYKRAAAQGNQAAARHAARLLALSNGAMTGAKAQLAKESAEALLRAGFGSDE